MASTNRDTLSDDQLGEIRTKVAFEMGSAAAMLHLADQLAGSGYGQMAKAASERLSGDHIQMLEDLRAAGMNIG